MNAVIVEGILSADPAPMPGRGHTMPACVVRLAVARPGGERAYGPILIPVMITGDDALRLIDSARQSDLVEFVGRLDSSEITRDGGEPDLSVWVVATSFKVLGEPF